MIPTRRLALAALALALVGCGKDKAKDGSRDDQAAIPTAGEGPARPANAPVADEERTAGASRARPLPVASALGFAMFPKDTDVLVGVDLATVRATKLYRMAKPTIQAEIAKAAGEEYTAHIAACGFDPLDAFQSAVLGGRMNGGGIVFLLAGVGPDALHGCLTGIGQLVGHEVQVLNQGVLSTYLADGDAMRVAWLGDAVFLFAPKASERYLLDRVDGRDSLDENLLMSQLLERVDRRSAFWLTMIPRPTSGMPMPLQGVYISVDFSAGLDARFGARVKDPDEAQKTVVELQGILRQTKADMKDHPLVLLFGKYFDKVEIRADGVYVVLSLTLGPKEYEDFVRTASTLLRAVWR